jgi:alpha-mannosidase
MGFLRRFQQDYPAQFGLMKAASPRFRIVGGGFTSPDNLLPTGEFFLRNFLTGLKWLDSVGMDWSGSIWLPDDFGHDSQLPILLQSMDVIGVSFSRIPGSCQGGPNPVPAGFEPAHEILLDTKTGGLDFWWQANDNSTVYSYYMPEHYCAGDNINNDQMSDFSNLEEARTCVAKGKPKTPRDHLVNYINIRKPLAKTPYLYLAIGCDFAGPQPNLPEIVSDWNTHMFPTTKVWVTSATFADYNELVVDHVAKHGVSLPTRNFHGSTKSTSFVSTPLWTGFYASRSDLKKLHHEVSRQLVASEIFNSVTRVFLAGAKNFQSEIDATWDKASPSTHHDYITGTAMVYVYMNEQLPLLSSSLADAVKTKYNIFSELIGSNGEKAAREAAAPEGKLFLFNPLSFEVESVVAVRDPSLLRGLPESAYQKTPEGEFLLLSTVPALGYAAISATELAARAAERKSVPVTAACSGTSCWMNNTYLQAQISASQNWGITQLRQINSDGTFTHVFSGAGGNIFEFRNDTAGDQYRFGFEYGPNFPILDGTSEALGASVLEKGPIRVTVLAKFKFTPKNSGKSFVYDVRYSLITNEKMLRISVTGYMPEHSSLFTKFSFARSIDSYYYGTPYHYDEHVPFAFGYDADFKITFEATHHFFLPRDSTGNFLCAVYQSSVAAWGTKQNELVGALLRNVNEVNNGTNPSDSRIHTVSFAVRIPDGLDSPSSSLPFKEALAYASPPASSATNSSSSLPSLYSLLTVDPPSILVTVVKQGTFHPDNVYIRVYNPTNGPVSVTLIVDPRLLANSKNVSIVSSMERKLKNGSPKVTVSAGGKISFVAERSLYTLEIENQ